MTFVNMQGVTHIYQDLQSETTALQDINLDVKQGEFLAIVGPSGCGKTTLLSILSGMLKPTHGSISIGGRDAAECDVGYMLQHDHLLEWQSIMSNAILGLKIQHKLNDDTRRYAEELLERYDLSEFANAYPNQLSGGMRQKVALIRTLAIKPEILLLDEPFSALDFQTRLSVANEVSQIIRSEGKTAILVTHDISEAVSLADRIVVLTSRPARIKAIHRICLSGKDSLERRTEPRAGEYFEKIWKELSEGDSDGIIKSSY